ncbi:MAG TPA: hypothetical protein VK524_06215, partial [Polyangiaceae bacterium]|nr:hypothetical protein [Polyangiaceae bacterium]
MKKIAARNARQPLLAAVCLAAAGCALETQAEQNGSPEAPLGRTESELRRSDFGMSRSLEALDATGAWQTVPLPAWAFPTTDSTARGPLFDRGVTSFTNLSWVGDANSYIDVFDSPLLSTIVIGGVPVTIDGSSNGSFFRVFYPYASNAELRLFFMEREFRFPRAVNVALPAGSRWRALRHYDRGECSEAVSYRTLLDAIISGLTPRLDAALREKDLGGATLSGSASGTPTLRLGTWGVPANADTFTVRANYRVGACDGLMRSSFTGRFATSGGLPTFTVTSVSAPLDFGDDACAGGLALLAGHWF